MVHSNTELLTDYWRARVPASSTQIGACPPRASVDPTHFLPLLPQVFILGRAAAGRYGFRLVGGLVADLHGHDLKGGEFLPLWRSPDRANLVSAMEGAARRAHPLVVETLGPAPGGELRLEIFLAPLAAADGAVTRFLGLYQPLSPLPHGLGRPLHPLAVRRIGLAAGGSLPAEAPRLRLAALDGRRIA